MDSNAHPLVQELAAPAFVIAQDGKWLGANTAFQQDDILTLHQQALCDFIRPYLQDSHKNITYTSSDHRVSLSLTKLVSHETLVSCHRLKRRSSTPALQEEQSYFVILDPQNKVICSSHPQLTAQQPVQDQMLNIFDEEANSQIEQLLAQLPQTMFSERNVLHKGQQFVFSAEPLGLDEMDIILLSWQNSGSGFQPISGISQRYRYLLKAVNGLTDGLIICDNLGKVVLLNERFHTLFPYTSDKQYAGWSVQSLAKILLSQELKDHPQKAQKLIHWIDSKFENNEPLSFSFRTKAGHYLEYRDRLTEQNERIGLIIDNTKTTILNQKLEDAFAKLSRDSEAKSQFMAVMGHEIRTPLNAIIGLLELSLGEPSNRENRNLLVAHRSAKHLLSLLNDVLEFTRFESSKVNLTKNPTDIRQLCEDVLITFAAQAVQHDFWLDLYVDPEVAKIVLCDDVRLTQVLHNLISNSLKFNTQDQPTVLIVVEKLATTGNQQTLKISVLDNGIGISKKEQKRIFKGFMQASEETHRKFGGSGLGLSICQKICHLMGSQLEVISEVGEGACLFFTADFECADQALPENYKSLSNSSVDFYCNHEGFTHSLDRYGQMLGFKVEYVPSPELIHILKLDAALLIDFNQSDIPNNHHFHEHLNQMSQKKASLVGTANVHRQSDIAQISLMPLKLNQIANLVSRTVEQNAPSLETGSHLAAKGNQDDLWHIQLLIVEDNEDNIYLFKQQIKSIGVQADFCLDPIEALELFKNKHFDVVITDYQMPGLTGAELAKKIRDDEVEKCKQHSQIFVLTADRSDTCLQACDAAEVDRLLAKPLSLGKLKELLQQINMLFIQPSEPTSPKAPTSELDADTSLDEHFKDRDDLFLDPFADDDDEANDIACDDGVHNQQPDNHETRNATVTDVEHTSNIDDKDPSQVEASAVKNTPHHHADNSASGATNTNDVCVDIQQIYEFTGDVDNDTLIDLVEQFLQNLETRAKSLTFAMQVADYAKVSSIAHSIKSSALYLGAKPLSQACQALEHAAKSAENEQQIEAIWQNVEREFARMRTFFKSWKP
ncbi:ATP-binding protein [Shewanella gelidii]|uniref:ATP-binding protein n=1 Tax=Shewanella gelidii TaxID=1642821 RepID=UPI00166B6DDE|nr:ATP-binding protein [Shewanella gelidii]MCL1096802.1 ATP-binding protein [Shewanella gelidii]